MPVSSTDLCEALEAGHGGRRHVLEVEEGDGKDGDGAQAEAAPVGFAGWHKS